MVQQDKFVFGITPAPSPLNPSPIIWRAYTNDAADEINVVDERTNTLVGTIGGGSSSYRYQKLPKTTISTLPYADTATARGAFYDAGLPFFPQNDAYIFLENGNLAEIDYASNHFSNGSMIYDCYDLQTLDPITGYWIAFRPSEADSSVLEKIAEVKMTADYYNNGYEYTYQDSNNANISKFVRFTYPNNDVTLLISIVTTLTISGTSVGSTITTNEVTNNFAGATVLSLYNANAPTPAAPGTANWNYRTPYYTGQDDYYGMMNGVDEGWIWYTDQNALDFGFRYMAGFNVLTGATSFINPITALAATTNLNPVGPINVFNFGQWASHPAGVVFNVYDQNLINSGNNNNGVTAAFSPRWTNNKIVVFLNGRDAGAGLFLNSAAGINNNSTAIEFNYGFDGLHLVQYEIYNQNGSPIMIMYRYKLDVPAQQLVETAVTPIANPGYDNGLGYYDWNDGFMPLIQSTEQNYNQYAGPGVNIWGQSEYFYWPTTSSKISQLQSNNTSYPWVKIDNKFYSLNSDLNAASILFGFQYDEYKLAN